MKNSIIEQLSLVHGPPTLLAASKTVRNSPEPFARVPLRWIEAASQLAGKTCQVAVALWYLKGVTGSATVDLSLQLCARLGASRYAVYRALKRLEDAKLVSVVRSPGRLPKVTVMTLEGAA